MTHRRLLPSLAAVSLTPESSGRTPRDPALDGLRGVAVLLVYLFHYGGGLRSRNPVVHALGYLTQSGWSGVEIFFALSGFLITRELWPGLREPRNIRDFFARRALRILPLYYGALSVAALAALLTGAAVTSLRPILIYAVFLQNRPALVTGALHYPLPLPLHHLWSLAVEVQFYLVWPFLLLLAHTRQDARRLCLWVFAITVAFRTFLWHSPLSLHLVPSLWSTVLLSRGGALALGGALAFSRWREAEHTRLLACVAFLTGILGFAIVADRSHTALLDNPLNSMAGLPAIEISSVALLALALTLGPLRKLLSLLPLHSLGRISYGFYVLHILLEPLFDTLGRLTTHATSGSAYQLVRLLVAFPITYAVASLSYRYLERPFLRWKRHFPHESTVPA